MDSEGSGAQDAEYRDPYGRSGKVSNEQAP
jgi:hypothetical protein